jgi:dienelactone hydrolase
LRGAICAVALFKLSLLLGAAMINDSPTPWAEATGKTPVEESPSHGYVIRKPVPGSKNPADYTFVLTRDEVYLPIAVRKPKGKGPFPAITMGWAEGRQGMKKIENLTESLAAMQDRMIARGYVVVTVNYRNEIPYLYQKLPGPAHNLPDNISGDRRTLKSQPTLDHEDLIAVLKYLKTLSYVDREAIGAMGVSHSGEMILKAAAEYELTAGICIEPAAHEFLQVNTGASAPRKDNEIQYNDIEVVRGNADQAKAMQRIARIHTPILIFGREKDHLQGIFQLTYEWMRQAGNDVSWENFDHPVHGYVFVFRQPDGSYQPDAIQRLTFEIAMAYFDKYLKDSRQQLRP